MHYPGDSITVRTLVASYCSSIACRRCCLNIGIRGNPSCDGVSFESTVFTLDATACWPGLGGSEPVNCSTCLPGESLGSRRHSSWASTRSSNRCRLEPLCNHPSQLWVPPPKEDHTQNQQSWCIQHRGWTEDRRGVRLLYGEGGVLVWEP